MTVTNLGRRLAMAAALFTVAACSREDTENKLPSVTQSATLEECIASTLRAQGPLEIHTQQDSMLGLVRVFSANKTNDSAHFSGMRVMVLEQISGKGSLAVIYNPKTMQDADVGVQIMADREKPDDSFYWLQVTEKGLEEKENSEDQLPVDHLAAQTINSIRGCVSGPVPQL